MCRGKHKENNVVRHLLFFIVFVRFWPEHMWAIMLRVGNARCRREKIDMQRRNCCSEYWSLICPFEEKDIIMTCQCQTKYTCTTVQPIIIINLYIIYIYMGQCNHPATSLLVGIGPSALRRHDDPRKRYKENKATGWFGALGKVTNYVFMILLIWKATWRQKTQVDFTWPACDLNLDGEVSLKRNAHIL